MELTCTKYNAFLRSNRTPKKEPSVKLGAFLLKLLFMGVTQAPQQYKLLASLDVDSQNLIIIYYCLRQHIFFLNAWINQISDELLEKKTDA